MKQHKLTILLMLFIFGLGSVLLTTIGFNYFRNEDTSSSKDITALINNPTISGTYTPDFIHIEGNWSDTKSTYDWCSGSGTLGDPYVIRNCYIEAESSPTTYGIYIKDSINQYFEIRDCSILGGSAGIFLENSCNGTVINNFLNHSATSDYGIKLTQSSIENKITENKVRRYDGGLYIENSNNNTIFRNLFESLGEGSIEIINSNNTDFFENQLRDCESSVTIEYCDENNLYYNNISNSGNFIIQSSQNVKSFNNSISGSLTHGFYLRYNVNTTIKNSKVFNNYGSGIYFENSCNDSKIIENKIYNNSENGIELSDTGDYNINNEFRRNIIYNNSLNGIKIQRYNINTTISKNTIYENAQNGIFMDDYCENASINENSVYNNSLTGIKFDYKCNNNTIYGNTLMDNEIGIEIENTDSKDNLFYKNCLINNTQNAVDNAPNNDWNSSTTGNYWSNYTGVDATPEDGIGDTSFAVWGGGNSIDYFPLMDYELVSLDHPTDLFYEAGTPNRFIKWEIVCRIPNSELTYKIWKNNTLKASGYLDTYFGEISVNLEGLNGGLYGYKIELDDGFGEIINDNVLVNVSNEKPTLSSKPQDLTLEIGDTNKSLQWNFTDSSVNNPVYSIKKNGTFIIQDHACNPNDLINVSLGNLKEGIYTYKIEIKEGFGEILSDSVKINVSNTLPRFLTKPDDLSFEMGATNYSLLWKFSDISINNSKYTLWRNDTKVIINKSCSPNQPINISLTNLDEGIYIYKIEVNDGYGGIIEDEAKVVITSTKTQPKSNAIPGWSIGLLTINIIASIATLSLVGYKFHFKKKE
jgi:parallel beta-helix repeat protein